MTSEAAQKPRPKALLLTLRLLGIYWFIGCLMGGFQIASMANNALIFCAFAAAGLLLLGAHEFMRWGLLKFEILGRAPVIFYGIIFILPQLARLFNGKERAWDLYILSLLGWALIAMAVLSSKIDGKAKAE